MPNRRSPATSPGTAALEELARHPWIDFDNPASNPLKESRPSLGAILGPLSGTASPAVTVLRLGAAGLLTLAAGPWFAWLPLDLLERLPDSPIRPLPVDIGRFRYRSGFIARRFAEDLPPFCAPEQAVRDISRGRQK